ncbi:hypothetical protein [Pseudomonas sp. ESBL1]|uniref:hypothetical protein n=1 Tax=Pseudomonas sp. ESBL1 TaxID=3077324 RepID=UPI002FC5D609
MNANRTDPTVDELLDGDDLEFLKLLAAERGVPVGELAKEGIQAVMAARTRPRPVRGVIQPFRSK